MENIRAFIAFPISDQLRARLGQVQLELLQNMPHLRPVKLPGIHLTLAFLGDISATQVYNVGTIMESVCKNHSSLQLQCRRLGAFPDLKSPRVLWAGLEGEMDRLAALQGQLADELDKIGFSKETRQFNPHLTLFRLKDQQQLGALRKRMEKLSQDGLGDIQCDTLVLYRSDLKPEGAVYTKLKMVALG